MPRGEGAGAQRVAYTSIVRLALFLLLPALAADDERATRFFDRIRFEKPDARDDEGRRVLEIFLKKEHWLGAYRTLEEKIGKFPDDLELAVDFKHNGDELGAARSIESKGEVSFNFKRLVEGQKKLDDLERL